MKLTPRTGVLNLVDNWTPGCWCAAVLKLCDERINETPSEDIRYPEQWMHVLWRPMTRALPYCRPDAWGFDVNHPQTILKRDLCSEPLYLLRTDECLWSAWIELAMSCDRHEPWFTNVLLQARHQQQLAERRLYVDWYGNRAQEFERFLSNLLDDSNPVKVPMTESEISNALDRVAADQHQEVRTQKINAGPKREGRITLLVDGSLRFLLVDGYGVPLEHFTLNSSAVPLLAICLAQRSGWQVPEVSVLLDLLPRCFVSWFDFREWLLDRGLPICTLSGGSDPA